MYACTIKTLANKPRNRWRTSSQDIVDYLEMSERTKLFRRSYLSTHKRGHQAYCAERLAYTSSDVTDLWALSNIVWICLQKVRIIATARNESLSGCYLMRACSFVRCCFEQGVWLQDKKWVDHQNDQTIKIFDGRFGYIRNSSLFSVKDVVAIYCFVLLCISTAWGPKFVGSVRPNSLSTPKSGSVYGLYLSHLSRTHHWAHAVLFIKYLACLWQRYFMLCFMQLSSDNLCMWCVMFYYPRRRLVSGFAT